MLKEKIEQQFDKYPDYNHFRLPRKTHYRYTKKTRAGYCGFFVKNFLILILNDRISGKATG